MDGLAIRAANELTCNPWDAACVEIGPGSLTIVADEPSVIALTGHGVDLVVNDRPLPLWSSIYVRRAWKIEVVRRGWGWAYLAVAGGVDVPLVLRSRSTYVRGGFGGYDGRALQAGDVIPVGRSRFGSEIAAREMIPQEYADDVVADVILGPQIDRFTEAGLLAFLSSEYAITLESDRMGYRLKGKTITHTRGADVVSDGLVSGAIQVPQSGQPILLMSDHATTGGYTKIATMTTLDTWRVAQCVPGGGKVRFRATSVDAAQQKYREMLGSLRMRVRDLRDEEWYSS